MVLVSQLDLYNQRLLEKREQEYKERLTLRRQGERSKEGPPVPAGKASSLFTDMLN